MKGCAVAIATIFLTIEPGLKGQPADRTTESKCASQMEQSSAALAAKDWPSLQNLSAKYLRVCARVLSEEGMSHAYEDLATACLNLGRPVEALQAANACIQVYYGNSGCHLLRVEALVKLNRLTDARKNFAIADRLVAHNLEQANNAKASVASEHEKALATSKLQYFQGQRKFADSLRSRYFEKQ